MKKLLLILLCMPLIGIGQACNYGGTSDASELCEFYQSRSFATYRNADIALDKILDVTGMSKRFVLKECNDISNCLATTYKGIRYVLYDRDFMDDIATNTNSWSSTSILAHEIGHHVNGHTLELGEEGTLSESRQMELEADEYSGFVMYKLGATLYQAQEAIRLISTNDDDSYSTHPSKDKRLRAIERGYNKAKGQSSNNDYSTNSSTLTAEDYFYKAYNSQSDWQYQIDNYTKCLRLDPDYYPSVVYYNRGIAYSDLGNYEDAIADYTRSIRIDPDYTSAYYNRAIAYGELGNYEDAIADYTRVIRIDPDDAGAYHNRGVEYERLKKWEDAIADYTRALRVDPDRTTSYQGRGLANRNLGNYEDAIADYTRAIRIDPDNAVAYLGRGLTYYYLENYEDAISDYTRVIRIDPHYTKAYYNRGLAYKNLGNYEDAIADYTRAIRIDPDYTRAYFSRGYAKELAGLPYCSDYKRACDLGDEDCCGWYDNQCK